MAFSGSVGMPAADSELQASQDGGERLAGWALEGDLQVFGGAPNEANLSLLVFSSQVDPSV